MLHLKAKRLNSLIGGLALGQLADRYPGLTGGGVVNWRRPGGGGGGGGDARNRRSVDLEQ